MTTIEVEVYPNEWVKFNASCNCGGQIKRITEGETWSLGQGHQTRPIVRKISYECAECGAPVEKAKP